MIYLEVVSGFMYEYDLIRNYAVQHGIPYDIIQRKRVERKHVVLDPAAVVIAGVETSHAVLRYHDKPIPHVDTYPQELREFLGRGVTLTTLGELPDGYVGFVKPAYRVKAWTGFVCDHETRHNLNQFSRHTEIYICDPVRFVSEYRYYLIRGEIVATGCYEGGPLPDPDIVEAIRRASPYTCTRDIGVLDDGRTVLVEAGDAYAVGYYGDDPQPYFEFCSARWSELMT